MIRCNDWEARLTAYLEPLREAPFAYGTHDCCTFAAGAVKAMTGEDLYAEFRGRYRTRRGAAIALGRHGAGTLEATIDAKLEPIPLAFTHRGDLVLAGGGLAIAMGAVAIQVGSEGDREGLIRRPRAEWTRAWRVPMPA